VGGFGLYVTIITKMGYNDCKRLPNKLIYNKAIQNTGVSKLYGKTSGMDSSYREMKKKSV
jgi:hypothetical protein